MNKTGTLIKVCRMALNTNRQLSMTPVTFKAATASDPIQALFVDKVRSYAQKSKAAGGGLVDATPQVQAKFQGELDRVQKSFGAVAGEDFTKFPTFNFQDTELEPVGVTVEMKADDLVAAEAAAGQEEDDSPWFEV